MNAKRSKADTINPCAVCGWAKHMAIHEVDHAYKPMPQVDEKAIADKQRDKPAAVASVFARAAWFLDDYARLLASTCLDLADDLIAEAQDLDCRLRELDGEWEAKRKAGSTASAAAIVADMLSDWQVPGAVWYFEPKKRWRVTGENYRPQDGEVCVGVYAPGAAAALLQEDFEEVEAREPAVDPHE